MRNIKLLLVDDEVEFVEALAERLRMRDIRGDTVFDGEEAIEFVGQDEPDVMVLDMRMPGIDGLEVLRHVRARYPSLQVIVLTGHGDQRDEDQAKRLGVFDYLRKPVDIDLLVRKIKLAHERKYATQVIPDLVHHEAGRGGRCEIYGGTNE